MGMLGQLDLGIKKIIDALDNNGLRENTLVLLMSDNGGTPIADNTPLQGTKHSNWEGGNRIPFIVSWPGTLKPGLKFHEMVMGFDIFPTFAGLAGLSMPDNGKIYDGVDFWPWLEKVDEAPAKSGALHDILFWDQNEKENFAWDIPIETFTWENTNNGIDIGIRKGDWKLRVEGGDISLYNLANDIGETNNVLDANTEIFEEMKTAYNTWHAEMPSQLEAVVGDEIGACLDPRYEEYEPDLSKVTRHHDTKCVTLIPLDGCRDPEASNFEYTVTNHIESRCEYPVSVESESTEIGNSTLVNVSLDGISIMEDVKHRIHVYDINGREVHSLSGDRKKFYGFDFPNSPGLYAVRVRIGESAVSWHRAFF
jgi:hypothetical protein